MLKNATCVQHPKTTYVLPRILLIIIIKDINQRPGIATIEYGNLQMQMVLHFRECSAN